MSRPIIELDRVSKRFCRTSGDSLRYESLNLVRKLLRLPPREQLGRGEFWALRDLVLSVAPGECLGIIGPNGAGKSTLLKLISGDYRPDAGRIVRRGKVTSLLRLGYGLQPLLTGRENIYLHLTARGLDKQTADRYLDSIVATAGLEKAIDTAIKYYSDGMYSRLEFAMTTAIPMDILLIDEVLSVGDMAFQARSLERIRELKQQGTTVLMVSHSEMNIRWVADRCLLLFDGEMLGCGATDDLYRVYYQSVGFQQPLPTHTAMTQWAPGDCSDTLSITGLSCHIEGHEGQADLATGVPAVFDLAYRANDVQEALTLVLQFWNTRDVLMASVDSGHHHAPIRLEKGRGQLRIRLPFLGLVPGVYRVAAGFRRQGAWIGYLACSLRLTVKSGAWNDTTGPLQLYAALESADDSEQAPKPAGPPG